MGRARERGAGGAGGDGMRGMGRLAWAFLRWDFRKLRPSAWLAQIGSGVMTVLLWYYISRMVPVERLMPQGESRMDYFTFALIGLALTQCVWRGFSTFSGRIRMLRDTGGLEALWNSPYPFTLLVVFTGLSDFLLATLNAAVILLIGKYGFGAGLTLPQIGVILAIGSVAALSMGGLGLLFASWTIAFDGGDGPRALLGRVIPFLSGVFFPVSLFPGWVRAVALCVPLTHAIALSRAAASAHAPLGPAWGALVGITACMGAAAWGALHLALRQARLNGRLSRASSS